ncbi:MAG TPA: sulfur carrier protein ThiS [Gemmatimonadaceae bacterium]|jgi:thiamine biosynthesis protein ThiS|nr:sulfur carrier protein ThiS [Gemmatimonadaceae bacterium]
MTTPLAHEPSTIALTVNGGRRTIAPGTSLSAYLASLQLDPRLVVIEHNREILRDRAAYPSIVLGEGDTLEIVHFVGGG